MDDGGINVAEVYDETESLSDEFAWEEDVFAGDVEVKRRELKRLGYHVSGAFTGEYGYAAVTAEIMDKKRRFNGESVFAQVVFLTEQSDHCDRFELWMKGENGGVFQNTLRAQSNVHSIFERGK